LTIQEVANLLDLDVESVREIADKISWLILYVG
jgi:hypothetical protein